VPDHLAGLQLRNVPNPFNPITDFRFNLPRTGEAEIRIFDLRGAVIKRITGGVMPAGPGTLRWAGHDKSGHEVASGIYFFRLYLDSRQEGPTLKMTLVK
jgi:flagellar hook assembly protein FlgD